MASGSSVRVTVGGSTSRTGGFADLGRAQTPVHAGLCTALLVRDAATLDTAFHQDASYLFHGKHQPGVDFVHRTVECTKAALGCGCSPCWRHSARAASRVISTGSLTSPIRRTRSFAAFQAWSVCRALSNILCFRVAGGDEEQLRVRDRLLAEGDFHLSTAVAGGRRYYGSS